MREGFMCKRQQMTPKYWQYKLVHKKKVALHGDLFFIFFLLLLQTLRLAHLWNLNRRGSF